MIVQKAYTFFRQYYLAILPVAMLLLATLVVYKEAKKTVREQSHDLFTLQAKQVQDAIERRLLNYTQILKGGKSLFVAADTVTRQSWKTYIETLQVNQNYPGIQGIGYAQVIRPHQLPAHINQIRAEGFPAYTVLPATPRDFYTSIIYLEPFTPVNKRAFGFDMFTEPVRRKAMQRACDTNAPALTGQVTLVQESSKNPQKGFLLYLPVYKSGTNPKTVADRRQLIKGFVYSPFRATDLITNIFQGNQPDFDIQLYDGRTLSDAQLLYSNLPAGTVHSTKRAAHTLTTYLNIAGHTWTLVLTAPHYLQSETEQNRPVLLLSGGIIISVLLLFVIVSLINVRKTSELYKITTENATAALFILDANNYCTFMNPAAEAMTGYTFEEIRQRPLHEMVHHHHPDGSIYPLQECPIVKAMPPHTIPFRDHEDVFIRKDGTLFNVSCALAPIYENSVPVSTLVEVRDITDQKRAEKQIEANAQRLQKMFYQAPAVVTLNVGPDLVYALANAEFAKLFTNREVIGKTFDEAHPDLSNQPFGKLIKEVYQTGKPFIGKEIEATIDRNNDGNLSNAFFSFTYEPIFNDEGKVDSVLQFAIEVTDFVNNRIKVLEINRELKTKNEELQRINSDLDNFVYAASHDLKSPITNLEGLLNALKDTMQSSITTDQAYLIKLMVTSATKLRNTVQDLTEITKVQKQIQESAKPLYFNDILQDVLSDIKPMVQDAGALINTNFEVKQINYAPKNLRSILYNLVSNAVKYQKPGVPPIIKVSTVYNGNALVLQVQDNGLGIRKDLQHKLFGMFTRLHQHVDGSGIGLYIIKRILENNGDKIGVESELDQGSTFSVYFYNQTAPATVGISV